jgi:hypothetical protein
LIAWRGLWGISSLQSFDNPLYVKVSRQEERERESKEEEKKKRGQ